jgi:hypothetical protein
MSEAIDNVRQTTFGQGDASKVSASSISSQSPAFTDSEASDGETCEPDGDSMLGDQSWARTDPGSFSAGVDALFGDLLDLKAELEKTTPSHLQVEVSAIGSCTGD